MDKKIKTKNTSDFRLQTSDFSSGFTLVELLIVTSIIAILILIALLTLNYKTQIQKARDTKRKNDLRLIQAKLEDYYNDNESYPAPLGCSEFSCCLEIPCNSNFLEPALSKFPCDSQGKPYIYCAEQVKSQWYKIYTNLEYTNDQAIQNSGCKNRCQVASGFCCNFGVSSSNTSIITESFCSTATVPTQAPTVPPTATPIPGGVYTACQVGKCNVVGDPESQCGPGKQFPVCFLDDLTCGNCNGPNCLPAPECYQ